MSLILDRYYLGSVQTSRDQKFFKKNKISHVLIAAKNLKRNFPDTIKYHQLNIADNPCTNILRHFPESFEFIDAIVTSNAGNVLVHCLGGISRSVTITIGYVMIKLNKNSKEAFDYVKNLHRKAYPNRGFLDQLKLFENVVVNYYEELEKADLAKVNNYQSNDVKKQTLLPINHKLLKKLLYAEENIHTINQPKMEDKGQEEFWFEGEQEAEEFIEDGLQQPQDGIDEIHKLSHKLQQGLVVGDSLKVEPVVIHEFNQQYRKKVEKGEDEEQKISD